MISSITHCFQFLFEKSFQEDPKVQKQDSSEDDDDPIQEERKQLTTPPSSLYNLFLLTFFHAKRAKIRTAFLKVRCQL